jgi:hypothetical protein
MASDHNQLVKRASSLIPKINLKIENFSERNIALKLDTNEMGYFLNKIPDFLEDKRDITAAYLNSYFLKNP